MPEEACGYCRAEPGAEHGRGCPSALGDYEAYAAREAFAIGYTDALKLPSKRGPHSDDPSYMLGWNKVDNAFGPGDGPRVQAGYRIAREIPAHIPLEKVREECFDLFGRHIHIQAKIGPRQNEANGFGLPIEAVDDSFLSGRFNNWPKYDNHVVYIGYFT